MNLESLFQAQKELREHINYNGEDRFEKLVLALLVEIGECANEWRGFKFWSKKQSPSPKLVYTNQDVTKQNADAFRCSHCGCYLKRGEKGFEDALNDEDYECPRCETIGMDLLRMKNPLLEEYVDGLHFVLEEGIELEVDINDWTVDKITKKDVMTQFIALNQSVTDLWDTPNETQLIIVLEHYLGLGEMLGFTDEQIEQVYFTKNQINHSRQENGY